MMQELTGTTWRSSKISFASPKSKRRCSTVLASFKENNATNKKSAEKPLQAITLSMAKVTTVSERSKTKKKWRGESYTLTSPSTKSSAKGTRKAKPSKTMPSKERLLSDFEDELNTSLYALFQTAILISYGKIELKKSKTEEAISISGDFMTEVPGMKVLGKGIAICAEAKKRHSRKSGYKEINKSLMGHNPWEVATELTKKLMPLVHSDLNNEKDYTRLLKELISWVSQHLKHYKFDSYESCISSTVRLCNSKLLSG